MEETVETDEARWKALEVAFSLIARERASQDKKWGPQRVHTGALAEGMRMYDEQDERHAQVVQSPHW